MALAGATHRLRKNVHFHRSERAIGSGYGGCAEEDVRGDFRQIGLRTGAYRVTVGELDRERLSAIRLELKRAAVDGDDVAAYARRRRLRAGGVAGNDAQAKEQQDQRANAIHGAKAPVGRNCLDDKLGREFASQLSYMGGTSPSLPIATRVA